MKNINILQIITAIMAVFSNRNFFSTMNRFKNIAKLFICGFAIVGLTACGGGGGGSSASNGGGNDPINITDSVNSSNLDTYTLQNLDSTFLDDIAQQIEDNSANEITITISNNSDTTSVTASIDSWETAPIDISGLVSGQNNVETVLTITITYLSNDAEVGTETEATLTITVTLRPQTLVFDQSSYSGTVGNTIQVSVSSDGTGAISYSIDDTDIATIDASGEITSKTLGQTTITATIAADSVYAEATATAELTVNRIQRTITSDSPISLDGVDATAQITIVSNGSTDDATYESADEAIATVSNSGLVTAVQTGEVTITVTLPQDNTHTDATATLQVQVCLDIVDCDGDGLIEINSLTKLHNMRYNLDATSYKTSAGDSGVTEGCPDSGCFGYELTTNLDFDANGNGYTWSGDSSNGYTLDVSDDNDVYFPIDSTTDKSAGWMPIGDNANSFTATFNGNGYTISNLAIRRAETYMGFFGYTSGATIRNIGLINNLSDYTGSGERNYIGGLIGYSNASTIIKSHTTGNAAGGQYQFNYVGGLIGRTDNNSTVIASYASGNVYGGAGLNGYVGGLIGDNNLNCTVIASYSKGNAYGDSGGVDSVGSLIGTNTGNVVASYATGNADGGAGNGDFVGGLVGDNGAVVRASYAAGNADGGAGSSDLAGKLIGLQNSGATHPQSYGFGGTSNGIGGTSGTNLPSGVSSANNLTGNSSDATTYAGDAWNSASDNTLGAWDFGDATQAPALKYADYDGVAGTDYSCGDDPSDTFTTAECGTLIPGQR